MMLMKHKPTDEVRVLLTEILRYTRKAVEEETRGQSLVDKTSEFDGKLTKSVELLEKSADRLEAATTELNRKLAMVSNTSSQLKSTANTYKDALLKVPT
jgi:hypothetical protein